MEEKKGFSEKLEAFFAGKGFYIVLLLSAAVIGTSIWLMVSGGADVENKTGTEPNNITQAAAAEQQEEENAIATMNETAAIPSPSPAPTPVPEKPVVEEEAALNDPAQATGAETNQPLSFTWPVSGAVERGYSVEALSYDRTMADWRTHDGWDIAAELGAQVVAVADGTVTGVYTDDLYGTVVEIDHGNGLCSVYANLAAVPTVLAGESVTTGQVIGAVGTTALCEVSETSHLHFAMKNNGVSADPAVWLPQE